MFTARDPAENDAEETPTHIFDMGAVTELRPFLSEISQEDRRKLLTILLEAKSFDLVRLEMSLDLTLIFFSNIHVRWILALLTYVRFIVTMLLSRTIIGACRIYHCKCS